MAIIANAQITIVDLSDPIISNTTPPSPSQDMLWLDTSNTPNVLKRWNGSSWVVVNDTKNLENKVTTLQTDFKTEQGKISSLIKETTITKSDGSTTSLKDAYNETVKTVEGNKTTINNVKSSVDDANSKISSMNTRITTIEETADGIKTTVSKAQANSEEAKKTATEASSNASNALSKANALEGKADRGEFNGRGVANTVVEYQSSTNGTKAPTGAWSQSVPNVANGSYLWTRTTITYTSGSPTIAYSVARMGTNGAKGDKGDTGQTGASGTSVTVESTAVSYGVSSSVSTKPTSFSPTMPTVAQGQYLWTKTVVTYSDGNSTETFTYALQGVNGSKGDKGDSGKDGLSPTVTSTKVEYQQSTNGMNPPSGTWSASAPTANAGQYMWTRTTVTYSDGKTAVSYSVSKNGSNGINGAKGDKGETGAQGASLVTLLTNYSYNQSQINTYSANGYSGTWAVASTENAKIGDTVLLRITNSTKGGYCYIIAKITAIPSKTSVTSVSSGLIDKGEQGSNGSDGKGISNIVHHYLVTNTTTGVTLSTAGWKDSPQSVTATNKYLWYYQTINYTVGNPTNTTPAIIGVYGDTGNKGATGKGITSVTPQYYLSTSNTTQSGGTWKTSQDAWSSGKYYWTRDSILWSDGTTTTTTPMLATALNNANSVANNAQTIANQTADKFTWIVKSGTNSTNFTLTDRTAQLVSDEINLKGLVKFSGLDQSTQKVLSDGKCLFPDLTFSTGFNDVKVYNNVNTSTYPNATKLERVARENDSPTSSGYCLKVTLGNGAFTGMCGFLQQVKARANAVFVQKFIAKLPIGYKFIRNSNQMGTGYTDEFITDYEGTGAYKEYVRVTRCGSSGTFSDGGYVYVRASNSSSANPTDSAPIVLYIASCTTYDMTETSDYNIWGMDEIPETDVTLINGGLIKTKTINTSQLNVDEILAKNGTFLNTINAQDINADRITSGKITSKYIDAYGLSILDKDTNIETFSIATNGQVTLRGSVESYDYVSGKSGWSINRKGNAEFNDVTVRGGVLTGDGGIVSSGGLGINLQKNTSFYDNMNNWVCSSNVWSVDQNIKYNNINSLKYNVNGLTADSASNCSTPNKTISAKQGDVFTAHAKFYTENSSAINGTKPIIKITFTNTNTNVLKEEFKTIEFVNKQWVYVSVTGTAPANTAYVCLSFVGYRNGTFWISQPKIEEGGSATEWSLAPTDKGQLPRFWAGATYENREYAPFIVYNDGSLKATKGTFGGVFTGDIKIGNVSIIDPNSSNGDDATITILNGNTGVRAVQLTDTSQSMFAQNVSITDNFYNEQVRISQNGTVNALKQFTAGSLDGSGDEKSILTNSYLQFKGGTITSSDKKLTVGRADIFEVGSVSNNTDLFVYGTGNFKNVLKVTRELNFNDTVKCVVSEKGVDFNFYESAQKKTCTIKWNTQGGSSLPDSYALQNEFVAKPTNPTYTDGALFIGWYKDKSCTQEWSFDYPVVDDMTLYAKWEEPSKPIVVDSTTNYQSNAIYYCLGTTTTVNGTRTAGKDWTINFRGFKGVVTSYKWTADMYCIQQDSGTFTLVQNDIFKTQTSSSVSGELLANAMDYDNRYELRGSCTITVKLGNTTKTFSYSGFTSTTQLK